MSLPVVLSNGFRIFIGAISPQTDEETLRMHFSQYGSLLECRLLKRGGESRGFGFVTYTTAEEAERALMLGQSLCGVRMKLERCDAGEASLEDGLPSKQLLVSHLGGAADITKTVVLEHFERFGEIEKVVVGGPNLTYVHFKSEAAVEDALHGIHVIHGTKVFVRKLIFSEDANKARQQERERAAREEHERTHGYAGYGDAPPAAPENATFPKKGCGMSWDVVHYWQCADAAVNAFEIFEEVCTLLRDKMHTVNRRLAGTVEVDDEATRERVLQRLGLEKGEVRKLVVKATVFSQECYEVAVREGETTLTLHSACLDDGKHPHVHCTYRIEMQQVDAALDTRLAVPSTVAAGDRVWLREKLAPAVERWVRGVAGGGGTREGTNTHALISKEEYAALYRSVKETWGRKIAENWTERTSAEKFVYEDCGIVSYLQLTWKRLGIQPRCFVDVGCGNGLLVHLLSRLGHEGEGVDVRKREIWGTTFRDDRLHESCVNPSTSSAPGDDGISMAADFLIGNHSDELTPWIPIMAARRNAAFFLLPCCAFNLTGKLPRVNGASLYEDNVNYAETVARRLGYAVERDRLAIPSTKRTALIGTIPAGGLRADLEAEIGRLVAECSGGSVFVPRPKVEKVRNCSTLAREVRETLTRRFFDVLLARGEQNGTGKRYEVYCLWSNGHVFAVEEEEASMGSQWDQIISSRWQAGGALPLGEAVKLLTLEEKKAMKEQCGGLQTFLKNQHQVFKVHGGAVHIKDWRQEETRRVQSGKLKTTPCWFHANHPQGCPLSDEQCTFLHSAKM